MPEINAMYMKALSASELAERFAKLAPLGFAGHPIGFTVVPNVVGFQFSESMPAESVGTSKQFKEFLAKLVDRPYVLASSGLIQSQSDGSIQLSYASTDGIVGSLRLQAPNNPAQALKILGAVEKCFNVTAYVDLIRETSPLIDQSAMQIRERAVADLQTEVQKLAEFLTTLSQREVENRQKVQAEMDAANVKRTEALEAAYRERVGKLDDKERAVLEEANKRDKAHADKVGQFQTQESKFMRRELLKRIEDALAAAEKMALSESTEAKRGWVHGFVWVLLGVSGITMGLMVYKVFTEQAPDWHVLAPLAGSTVTFVATMLYYLKWNDRWFREHADAEFAAKRYRADILRASWVAELVNEWAKEGKGDLSPDLVAAYTRNLFREVGTSRVSEHPLDQLTGLIKRATEVEFGKGMLSLKAPKLKDKATP